MKKSDYKLERSMLILFSFLTLFVLYLKIWPFVTIFLLFIWFYTIQIRFNKKLTTELNIFIVIFFIILLYLFLKYFSLIINPNLWYYKYLIQTSELFNSDFVTLIIFGLYAIFTYGMFSEMKKARILESKYKDLISEPNLNSSINYMDGFFIRIKNLSKGPALKVEVKMQTNPAKDSTYKLIWKYDLIDAGEYYDLVPPHGLGNFEKFIKDHDSIDVEIKYLNISEKKYNRKFKHNLKEITLFQYPTLLLKRGPLDDISDSLKNISQPFSGFGLKLDRDLLEEIKKLVNRIKKDNKNNIRTNKTSK